MCQIQIILILRTSVIKEGIMDWEKNAHESLHIQWTTNTNPPLPEYITNLDSLS